MALFACLQECDDRAASVAFFSSEPWSNIQNTEWCCTWCSWNLVLTSTWQLFSNYGNFGLGCCVTFALWQIIMNRIEKELCVQLSFGVVLNTFSLKILWLPLESMFEIQNNYLEYKHNEIFMTLKRIPRTTTFHKLWIYFLTFQMVILIIWYCHSIRFWFYS